MSKVEELVTQRDLIIGFYRECYAFDWLYEYSDDHSVYEKGDKAHQELSARSLKNYALYKTYQAFYNYWEDRRKGKIVSVPEIKDFIDLPVLHPDLTEKK